MRPIDRSPGSACLLLLLILVVGGCNGNAVGPTYKLYPGPPRPARELAILSFSESVDSIRVDGMLVAKADYGRIEIQPGFHRIGWGGVFISGVGVSPRPKRGYALVELFAGHRYSVGMIESPTASSEMWIRDETSGRLIAEVKKP